jgi:hypothetical protein
MNQLADPVAQLAATDDFFFAQAAVSEHLHFVPHLVPHFDQSTEALAA